MLGEVPAWQLGVLSRALPEGRSQHRESHWFHKRSEIPAAHPDTEEGTLPGCRVVPILAARSTAALREALVCHPTPGLVPPKREGSAHLVRCQQRLAEGFSPVDGEPGTGYLHPPGKETRSNGWGRAFWEEQAAMKARSSPLGRKQSSREQGLYCAGATLPRTATQC